MFLSEIRGWKRINAAKEMWENRKERGSKLQTVKQSLWKGLVLRGCMVTSRIEALQYSGIKEKEGRKEGKKVGGKEGWGNVETARDESG